MPAAGHFSQYFLLMQVSIVPVAGTRFKIFFVRYSGRELLRMNRRQVLTGLTAVVPLLGYSETQSQRTHVIHRVSATGKVNAPCDSVDLAAWAFHLTSDEYVDCAPGEHKGWVQAALPSGKRTFISVETIAGSFMVHHYIEDIAERSHMRVISSSSQLWWNSSTLPTSMRVTWELRLQSLSPQACQLNCAILVETDNEALLTAEARRPPGTADPVQAHCTRETPMFAADLERKALKGIYAP